MSSLLLLSWIFLLQISASSSSSSSSPVLHHPESPDVSPDSPDSLLPPSECPSCALARVRRGEEDEGREDVVEAVKRHILNMLHLQQRPNITRPVPRAALINALRKLHVGRVGRTGAGGGEEPTETTEIITFAEAASCELEEAKGLHWSQVLFQSRKPFSWDLLLFSVENSLHPGFCPDELMRSGTSVIILSDGEGFLAQAKCRPPFSNTDTKRFCPVFSRLDSCVPVHLQQHTEHN
ncbi:Inhibin beta A chain [Dissostichus eleginoides]|uniref:Inhibin beta A chain n=1 Tax=Dissostichus eleginoides TaxID=100907 RepID=A0AAD9B0T6_DISEL|nr:Inhibin beta A chain [Dissostichus eleginoides]